MLGISHYSILQISRTPSNSHWLQSKTKPARTADGDAGELVTNHEAKHGSSFKLQPSTINLNGADSPMLAILVNSCPKQSRIAFQAP
jgi:hypothetical protein